MVNARRITAALIIIGLFVLSLLYLLKPKQNEPSKIQTPPADTAVAALPNIVSTALFDVANAKGLFQGQNLDVKIQWHSSGTLAVDELLRRKADFAAAADFVVVSRLFGNPNIRILASIARPEMHELIARKDRGILEPKHLRGKRIAVTQHTSGDFFLRTFLTRHGIPASLVKLVYLRPSEIAGALFSGKVDAAVTWQPKAMAIMKRLGPKAVQWPAQCGQAYYILLVTRDDVIKQRPRMVERFLKALTQSENYAAGNTPEAQSIVAERLGYRLQAIEILWPATDVRIRLDQDILTLMENEAKWIIRHQRLKKEIPNYLNIIHDDILRKIQPQAVTIIN